MANKSSSWNPWERLLNKSPDGIKKEEAKMKGKAKAKALRETMANDDESVDDYVRRKRRERAANQ
jgi:hypothetical protein